MNILGITHPSQHTHATHTHAHKHARTHTHTQGRKGKSDSHRFDKSRMAIVNNLYNPALINLMKAACGMSVFNCKLSFANRGLES